MMIDLQKASMWKRISAFLFDGILLVIVAVMLGWALSSVMGYDNYVGQLDAAYARYSELYGVNLEMTLTEYETLTPEQVENLNAAYEALASDQSAASAYSNVIMMMLLLTTLGILFAYAIMEFIIPLCLKNGQTLGKLIFGVGVMRQDFVAVDGRILFIRTFLGKYTLETMIPVLISLLVWFGALGFSGTLLLAGVGLAQLILLIVTKKRLAIHDAISKTVTVDLASQRIFESPEAVIAYKKKLHAQQAAREVY